jgi:membrane protein DedA with SNARE-associated domain
VKLGAIVDGILESILSWLAATEGPLGYLVLFAAALIEYVVPPFPGDTIAVFGIFLATGAGYSAALVWGALNVGAVLGGLAAYAVGRSFADATRRPRWLRGPRAEKAIADVVQRYERHGAWVLALNRFVPALRAFFFVGAGVARMPVWKVVVYGGASAAAWNGVLLGLGIFFASSWRTLLEWTQRYTTLSIVILVLLVAAWAARRAWRAKKPTER